MVSEIGESRDFYRFEIEQDDLKEAVMLYSFFKGNKINFARIHSDKRCKIQPIEKFQWENHWCVDRWWSKEEFKIQKKKLLLKIEEFPFFFDEILNNLISVKKEVRKFAIESDSKASKPKFVKKRMKEIFDLTQKTNNRRFTKTFIEKNKGTIPVYSASKFPEKVGYGYVKDNLKEIKYFKNCLTWNINGSIGKAHYRSGKFSLSGDVIPLIVKDDLRNHLDLIYLKYAIEMEFRKYNFSFDNKAGKEKIKDIELSIPIDEKQNFDIFKQKELSEKLKKFEEIQKSIFDQLNQISNTEMDFE